MERHFALTLLCAVFITPALGQTTATPLPPATDLESFAAIAGSKIVWSKDIGRFDTDRAHVIITALTIENLSQSPSRISAVRIDLTQNEFKDRLYTSEALLGQIVSALDGISTGAALFLMRTPPNGSRCFGSGAFRNQVGHAFSASQCVFADWRGLSVSTGTASFQLVDVSASQISEAFSRAREELRKR